jgi:hypothetical protein
MARKTKSSKIQVKIIGKKVPRSARAAVLRVLAAEKRKRTEARPIYEEYNESIKELAKLVPVGTIFQQKGCQAFKLVVPRGGFTVYREIDIAKPTITELEAAGLEVV